MIKKSQFRLILLTMSILFVVFTVIFCITFFIMNNMNERNIKRTLSDTTQTYLLSDKSVVQPNTLVATVTANTDGSFLFTSQSDEHVFTTEEVKNIVEVAIKRPYTAGKIGNVFYEKTTFENSILIVACDMSQALDIFRYNVLNAFFSLLGTYTLLFLLVWMLSYRIFRPIKETLKNQKQFISNASHELKTPLTIISASVDVLNQEETNDNRWLKNIKSQTERMEMLVTDMLTLAKLDEGKLEYKKETFNLSDEIISSTLPFDAVAFEKGKTLTLSVAENIQYTGDRQSVRKIINILLDNAVKHASTGGEIKVFLTKENGKTSLTVFNTGSNVPDKDSNKIFERFYRGDNSRSRDSGGSGLGLSIAKSIANANKWKISARSRFSESMKITLVLK